MVHPYAPHRRRPRGPKVLGRLARGERGAVLVEFGIVAPMLCLLMCAIIDFSMAMFTMNNLTTAVREGARLAATLQWTTASQANDRTAVQNRVRGQITMSFVSRGGRAGTITVTNPDVNTGNIMVTLSNYDYVPVFGVGSWTMARRAVFRHERWQPPAT